MDRTITADIQELIRERNWSALREAVAGWPAPEIADLLQSLNPVDRVVLFRILPRAVSADVFAYLDTEQQNALLMDLSSEEARRLLAEMTPDDRTALFEELPGQASQKLLNLLSPDDLAEVRWLLGYPEDSVGRLMTPDYIAVRRYWTVEQALAHIRERGRMVETINVVYVVDRHWKLLDALELRQIILAEPQQTMEALMDGQVIAISAFEDREQAVRVMQRYDLDALPVVDSDGVLLGIITIDDVLDVAQEEATEDIHKIGGSEALDEPYMQIAFHRMIRKRAGWLVILFLSEMLTATAMSFFEEEIARAVVLALFVPLIISSGGNSGSQAATLVIRALALGEVTLRDWWRVARREVLAGLTLGVILGSIGFLRITLWQLAFQLYGPHWLLIALTVGIALVGVVTWGTIAGSMLPLLLKRLGFDPATSSAPFVATLVDVTGLVIYFSVAAVILRGTLL
ncbi:magnesium transporter [Kallotenue papyrolyticum]|uniref:magnesium transporter n=1 Tax=Kallotenue papyrolyticum TaxID=1325125 RepID=UPI0004786272|nr:magnesium transporter [Kallotenue papyrolyticum]